MHKQLLLFIVLCLFLSKTNSQTCKVSHGYVSQNQQYTLKPNGNSKIDVVFYTGFSYRIELCSQYKSIKLNLILVDEKGNIQFNKNITYGFLHDFRFETVFHGQIIVSPITMDDKNAELLIGFKKL